MSVHKAIQAMQVHPPGESERCAGAAVGGATCERKRAGLSLCAVRTPISRMDYNSPSCAAGCLGLCGTGECAKTWAA